MKQQPQAGLTTLQIIIGLALVAVALGLLSTLITSDEEQDMGGVTESAVEGNTPLETFADNRAAEIAQPVTDAVTTQNQRLESEMDSDMDSMDTMDAVIDNPDVEETAETSPTMVAMAGSFVDYDPTKLSADGTNILFFHASWCPSCRSLEDDINANLDSIPENTHILKLDYDSETELKRKYGVVRQHTLVVVDADGNEIKKLTGLTNTLDQVVGQI